MALSFTGMDRADIITQWKEKLNSKTKRLEEVIISNKVAEYLISNDRLKLVSELTLDEIVKFSGRKFNRKMVIEEYLRMNRRKAYANYVRATIYQEVKDPLHPDDKFWTGIYKPNVLDERKVYQDLDGAEYLIDPDDIMVGLLGEHFPEMSEEDLTLLQFSGDIIELESLDKQWWVMAEDATEVEHG